MQTSAHWTEAEQHYRRAIELAPANLVARNNLAMALLASGRYEEAWPYFEDRWANFVDADGQPASGAPNIAAASMERRASRHHERRPGNARNGARLLVIPEQGHGDSLQFVRYLPMALERFARVGYMCPPSLRRLYEESFAHVAGPRDARRRLIRPERLGPALPFDVTADGVRHAARQHSRPRSLPACGCRSLRLMARAACNVARRRLCRVSVWCGPVAIQV